MKLTRRQRTLLSDVCADLAKAVIVSYVFQLFIFTQYPLVIIIPITIGSVGIFVILLRAALILRKD